MENYYPSKELFLRIMNFEQCERTLNWEFAYWGETLNRWYNEGLKKIGSGPTKYNYGDCILGQGALGNNSPSWSGKIWDRDKDISTYFDFDEGILQIPYFYWIYPHFKKEIIFEDQRYIELIDTDGVRKKILKDNSCMPFWLEWPLKNRNDWEKIKEEKLSLDSINKRFDGNLNKFAKSIKNNNELCGIFDPPVGFFGSLRALMGEEKLYLEYYDDPVFLKDILDHLCRLWIAIGEELTSKINFDLAIFWEDMAGKNGSLISPATFREFITPYYKKLINFLKSKGIKYFSVDCDGNVNELIPLFLEVGINIIYPFEQQAGNDLLELRRKYPKLGILGGFDKNALFRGIQYIDEELNKIKLLIKGGGYIPFADHAIPPNSPWENFKYYRNKLKRIIFSTTVLHGV